jgi:hypothetical protein
MRPMFVAATAAFLIAESGACLAQMSAVEQALAEQIKCDEWKKNQNGGWTSKPDTKLGSYSFSNTTVAPGQMMLDGADVGTVLNRKCGNSKSIFRVRQGRRIECACARNAISRAVSRARNES